ncbi:uncharacterized protein [Onthophagus taurus]|uniref:uncharacterized protein n=1 Tax=Onthophagus taurus TaxID=166361 RepID=UPI0039BDCB90
MKWNSNISKFLEIYENFPILWNIKLKNYHDTKLRDAVFEKLTEELKAEGLVEDMTPKQLKSKIKSIKDAYRQELAKIEKSKKSGMGTDDIYTPKLIWFGKADFLRKLHQQESQNQI